MKIYIGGDFSDEKLFLACRERGVDMEKFVEFLLKVMWEKLLKISVEKSGGF